MNGFMKSIVLLFISVVMLIKPLWPIAEYIMNYDYIANVLCENKDKPQLKCDGKCYLAKKLAQESQEQEENPFANPQKMEFPKILQDQTEAPLEGSISYEVYVSLPLGYMNTLFSRLLVYDIGQPPEA
jgi:hypothetical protein